MSPPRDERAWPEGTSEAEALAREAAAGAEVDAPLGAEGRVWARLEARRGTGRRRRWLGFGALSGAALGVAALALLVGPWRTPAAPVALAPIPDGAARALSIGQVARVVKSEGGRASVAAAGGAGVVPGVVPGVMIDLRSGSLLASVTHRSPGAPFIVRTPSATVRVVGTVLWVSVDGPDRTTVLVGRGAVEVTVDLAGPGAAPVRVAAGERWPRESDATPDPADLALLGADALADARFAPPAVAAAGHAPAPAVPLVAVDPAVPRPTTPPAVPAPPGSHSPSSPGGSAASPPDGPAVRAPAPSECRRLGSQAAPCWRRIADSGNPLEAEMALFELGRTELHDQHDARAALLTWDRQRKRFPSGALRTEADVSVIEALVKLDERPRARREIDSFLARHADSVDAPLVHFLSGTLARADRDCARAVRDFDAALRAPDPSWSARARTERDACLPGRASPGK